MMLPSDVHRCLNRRINIVGIVVEIWRKPDCARSTVDDDTFVSECINEALGIGCLHHRDAGMPISRSGRAEGKLLSSQAGYKLICEFGCPMANIFDSDFVHDAKPFRSGVDGRHGRRSGLKPACIALEFKLGRIEFELSIVTEPSRNGRRQM